MNLLDISLYNWFSFLLINASLLFASYCLSSKATYSSSFSTTLASTLMIYLAQVTVVILLFGALLQTLNVWVIGVATLSAACGQIFYYHRYKKPFFQHFFSGFKAIFSDGDKWLYILFFLLVLQVIFNLYKVYILPVHIFDSLVYRAPPAPYWFQLGKIPFELDVPVIDMNGKALGIAVLMLWYFIFLGDSIFANSPEYIVSLILLLLVFSAARQSGATRSWSFKIAIMVYFIPGVLIESVSTQDHLAVNTAFIAVLFFIREFSIKNDKSLIPLIGVALGLLFSFKINAVVYLPVIALASSYVIWNKRLCFSKGFCDIKKVVSPLVLITVLTFSIGGYWMAKNVIVYNDIFGISFNVMKVGDLAETLKISQEDEGSVVFSDSDNASLKPPEIDHASQHNKATNFFKMNNLFANIKLLPERLLDGGNKHKVYAGHFNGISAFGPQFFSLGVISFAFFIFTLFCKKWRLNGSYYIVMGSAMLLLYFCIMLNQYAYRNFIFFPVCVFIYSAVLLSSLNFDKKKLPSLLINGVIFSSLLWSAWHLVSPIYANPYAMKEFISLERHYQSPARYSRLYAFSPDVYRMLDEMPRNEPIIYVNGQRRNTWIYNYFDVKWKRPVIYIPLLDNYFQCYTRNSCIPTQEFKDLLRSMDGHIVNLCVAIRCLRLKDPQFFEVAQGVYYFHHGGNE